MPVEQELIEAINRSQGQDEGRPTELIYAEWLEERGECELAECWRVLVEQEKRPDEFVSNNRLKGWWWWNKESVGLFEQSILDYDSESLYVENFNSYFQAMQEAAFAYVCHTYDPEYTRVSTLSER